MLRPHAHREIQLAEVWSIVLAFGSVNGGLMVRTSIYHIFCSRFYAGTYGYPKSSGIWHAGRRISMVNQKQFHQLQGLCDRGRKWPLVNGKPEEQRQFVKRG